MSEIMQRLGELKLVPVVKIEDAKDAGPLADAILAGGLPCAEITFRTAAAPEAIKTVAARGDMVVGAGTVLTVDQAKQAVDCGAQFIVSPGFSAKVVDYCVQNKIIIAPGVATPTDVQMALEFGLEVLKFFPAEAFGGLKSLKAIAAPFGQVKFIPTGGVSAENLLDYLRAPMVVACGGSWMVKADLISGGRFDEITKRTAEAVALAQQA